MAEIVAETMVRRWALALFGLIPGAELHLFDECGRWVQWDQAARFNEVVSAWHVGSVAEPPSTVCW